MKSVNIVACCLLVIPFTGAPRKRTPSYGVPIPTQEAALRASLREGRELFLASRYQEAADLFQSVLDNARSFRLPALAGRATGNLGSCRLMLHQYREALRLFLEAYRQSEAAGDTGAAAAWHANIASVYVQMGEYRAAAEWVEQSMARMSGHDRDLHLPALQLQLATLRARQGRMADALQLFGRAINGADRAGNLELYATAWNRLGEEFLQQGDLPRAEPALLESYRVRKLHRLALVSSYRNLGRLRMAQGDLESAATLLNRAVELSGGPGDLVPGWQIYHSRGRVRLAQGRLREALDDFRVALGLARAWRRSTPADDTTRMAAEGTLDQLHSAVVEAGNRLYLETHDAKLLEETFAAEEENRAASLRALLNQPDSRSADVLPSYGEAVARLERAEVASLHHERSEGVETARAELIRQEASLGPELRPLPPDLVEAGRRALDAQSVLLSFHLGPSISWLWALDRAGLAIYPLPPRDVIQTQARAAVAGLREDLPSAEQPAAQLYGTLFSPLAARFQNAPHWLLALDESLFEVPIAALVLTRQPRPVYVAERHTVELIPGVALWLDSLARLETRLAPLFVGVGDPVYNRADPRLGRIGEAQHEDLALPRLVGSSAEIEACSRAWNGPAVLLRGPDASRERLEEQLSRHPSVLHLATHYLESAARPNYRLIALSLRRTGEAGLLTPFEISRWHIQTGLVVLSGCHSAAGAPLPATGLQGLTRAWLAAGAQSVVGSLWDTPDDEGALFDSLYRNLRTGGQFDAAGALHEAQLDMIRSGGRRARPAYWGTYFIVRNPRKLVPEPWN